MKVPLARDLWHDAPMLSFRAFACSLPLCLLLGMTVAPVQAQADADAQIAEARRHYEVGAQHFAAEAYESALMSFQQAYALSERSNILYDIHLCHERLGQLPEAIEYLELFMEQTPDSPELGAMEQRLADLGRRLAEVEAAIREEREDAANDPLAASPGGDGPWGPPTLAGFSLGVAGLSLGATFMVLAGGVDNRACEATSSCTPEALDRAGRYQTIGLAGFGVGAIGLGLGLYYLLTAESDDDTQAELQPILAPTYAGVRVQGTY